MKKENINEDEFKKLIELLNAFEEALLQWNKVRQSVIGKTKKEPTLQLSLFKDEEE